MINLITEILAAIWFFLPMGIANSVPIIVIRIPVLKNLSYPMDFGKSWKGVRILGDHKTFRGLISGIVFGFLVVALQVWLYSLGNDPGCGLPTANLKNCTPNFFMQISWINYSQVNWILFGLLAGAGPLLGDAIKSFFKRRQNLKPGATWFPFDQIDYIIGGIIFTLPIVQLVWWRYVLVAMIWLIMHPLATVSGYLLKLKESPI